MRGDVEQLEQAPADITTLSNALDNLGISQRNGKDPDPGGALVSRILTPPYPPRHPLQSPSSSPSPSSPLSPSATPQRSAFRIPRKPAPQPQPQSEPHSPPAPSLPSPFPSSFRISCSTSPPSRPPSFPPRIPSSCITRPSPLTPSFYETYTISPSLSPSPISPISPIFPTSHHRFISPSPCPNSSILTYPTSSSPTSPPHTPTQKPTTTDRSSSTSIRTTTRPHHRHRRRRRTTPSHHQPTLSTILNLPGTAQLICIHLRKPDIFNLSLVSKSVRSALLAEAPVDISLRYLLSISIQCSSLHHRQVGRQHRGEFGRMFERGYNQAGWEPELRFCVWCGECVCASCDVSKDPEIPHEHRLRRICFECWGCVGSGSDGRDDDEDGGKTRPWIKGKSGSGSARGLICTCRQGDEWICLDCGVGILHQKAPYVEDADEEEDRAGRRLPRCECWICGLELSGGRSWIRPGGGAGKDGNGGEGSGGPGYAGRRSEDIWRLCLWCGKRVMVG